MNLSGHLQSLNTVGAINPATVHGQGKQTLQSNVFQAGETVLATAFNLNDTSSCNQNLDSALQKVIKDSGFKLSNTDAGKILEEVGKGIQQQQSRGEVLKDKQITMLQDMYIVIKLARKLNDASGVRFNLFNDFERGNRFSYSADGSQINIASNNRQGGNDSTSWTSFIKDTLAYNVTLNNKVDGSQEKSIADIFKSVGQPVTEQATKDLLQGLNSGSKPVTKVSSSSSLQPKLPTRENPHGVGPGGLGPSSGRVLGQSGSSGQGGVGGSNQVTDGVSRGVGGSGQVDGGVSVQGGVGLGQSGSSVSDGGDLGRVGSRQVGGGDQTDGVLGQGTGVSGSSAQGVGGSNQFGGGDRTDGVSRGDGGLGQVGGGSNSQLTLEQSQLLLKATIEELQSSIIADGQTREQLKQKVSQKLDELKGVLSEGDIDIKKTELIKTIEDQFMSKDIDGLKAEIESATDSNVIIGELKTKVDELATKYGLDEGQKQAELDELLGLVTEKFEALNKKVGEYKNTVDTILKKSPEDQFSEFSKLVGRMCIDPNLVQTLEESTGLEKLDALKQSLTKLSQQLTGAEYTKFFSTMLGNPGAEPASVLGRVKELLTSTQARVRTIKIGGNPKQMALQLTDPKKVDDLIDSMNFLVNGTKPSEKNKETIERFSKFKTALEDQKSELIKQASASKLAPGLVPVKTKSFETKKETQLSQPIQIAINGIQNMLDALVKDRSDKVDLDAVITSFAKILIKIEKVLMI